MSEKQKSQEVIPKEITELLEHRATLGTWLAKLEELSGTVRPEVYDRVRGDYEARLRSQETELTAHRSEMETALEERKTRVTVLESDRDERAAELEEAQLRFAVGEFKEAEFQKHKSAHEDRLTTLNDELKSDQDALAKLEEVVGVLSSLRAGSSGSAAGSAAAMPEPSGSAEGETSWGTAHGRAEEGVEGAVEKTKSAAAAAAVAVADARAAEAAGGAILESEEAIPEPQEAGGPEPKGAEARWREAVKEAKPEEAEAEGAEETAESATEEAPPEAEAAEAAADSAAESIVESPADAAAKAEGAEGAEGGDYLDDLEFLESLSMDEIDRLDAVSAMLEDEPAAEGDEKGSEESR